MKQLRTAATTVILAALATSCGGSSGGTPAPTGTASSTSGTSASQTAGPGSAPANPAAARAEISSHWAKFFASTTPRSVSVSLLENGASLGPALQKAEQEDAATGGHRSATVTHIEFTSATQANVNYTLVAAGRTLKAAGVAVLQGGSWKVSATTFCTLVVLGNGERPVRGCS